MPNIKWGSLFAGVVVGYLLAAYGPKFLPMNRG
jgi:hypothetical protein